MKTNLLRTTVLFLIFSFSVLIGNAQWVSIPDTNFGTWLNTNYAGCMQGNGTIGWQMDTTCPAVVGETNINCSYANITDLTGITYFDNLADFNCGSNQLTTVPPLPQGVWRLQCTNNEITSLPFLPTGLRTLICFGNAYITFPIPLPNLTYFDCGSSRLTALPDLPSTLSELRCERNELTTLPTLPQGLWTLYCSGNQLRSLSLPAGLGRLRCDYNPLYTLPDPLPVNLTELDCTDDSLSALPALPWNLRFLLCRANMISTIPTLPSNLFQFTCGENLFTSLPPLPSNLWKFECNATPITSLPALPNSIKHLSVSGNQFLTELPELPDSLNTFSVAADSNLKCLPRLKRIVTMQWGYGTPLTCKPNYGNVTWANPSFNLLPLCEAGNTNGCDIYYNISGRTYSDFNANCSMDSTDEGVQHIKMQLRNGGNVVSEVFADQRGFYSLDTDSTGNYEVSVDTSYLPFSVSCPANNLLQANITTNDSLDYDMDFAVNCNPGFDVGVRLLSAWGFRPARFVPVNIGAGDLANFYGMHCANGVSGDVTITISGAVSYISPSSGALTPSSVNGNIITYNVADFVNNNFRSDFNILLQVDTSAPVGSQVCITITVSPTSGDNIPSNNSVTSCFTILNSCDPNSKEVSPPGNLDPTGDGWLTYTINFQNTGTDTALYIYITDTLDSNLDISTFQMHGYSHQPLVQIKENAVRFSFPNINLPDSNTNEPLSHGYVQYKIKIKDGKPVGTVINNTAFIYFDFNEAVVTNTTTNTIAVISGVEAVSYEPLAVRVYPNPASDVFTISVDEGMIGGTAIVTDVTGRKMAAVKLTAVNGQLTTENFANGVYFVTVSSSDGRSVTKKLIIQK